MYLPAFRFVIDAKLPIDKQCPKADPWFYVVMADEMPEPMKEGIMDTVSEP